MVKARRDKAAATNFPTKKLHMNSSQKALIIQTQQIFVVTPVCMLFSHSNLKAHLGEIRASEQHVNAVITLALTAPGSLQLTS